MKGIALGLALVAGAPLLGLSTIDEGPIHEGYIQPIEGGILLSAVEKAPPEREVVERLPASPDEQADWLSGYWAWNGDSYVWMSGVWRRPPPGHLWIEGSWKEYPEGWVWSPGFWSPVAESELEYIGDPPPDPIEEEASDPPVESFWMPGYWSYNESSRDYAWVSGEWMRFDPNWVLVPAHYVWRPQGYVFIRAYWDWPLESRGSAYAPVRARGGETYTPDETLDDETLVRRLVVYYPNYLCFYHHHYYYHYNFWAGWWGTPPWWGWNSWWSFGWGPHWDVWWWYTHPGFPHPIWLNKSMAGRIWPAPRALRGRMRGNWGWPLNITPHGMAPVSAARGAMGRRGLPVLPANPRRREDLIRGAVPERHERPLRPEGRAGEAQERRGIPGPRPDFGPRPDVNRRPPTAPPLTPGRRPPIGERGQRGPRPTAPQPVQPGVRPHPPRPAPGRGPSQVTPPGRGPSQVTPPGRGPSQVTPPGRGPSQVTPPGRGPSQVTPPGRGPSQVTPPGRGPSEVTPPSRGPSQVTPQPNYPSRMAPRQYQPRQYQPRQVQPRQFQPQRSAPSGGGYQGGGGYRGGGGGGGGRGGGHR
ncbi:MAG: hypothetical protein AB7F31_01320 [Parachlamydiales bacterium]